MNSPVPLAPESVVLAHASSRVFLAPARGGMATRFFVGDRAVFYLDEATLLDPTKNVRGGNPVLFPSPGRLPGDRFTQDGRSGAMGQHGFARAEAWEVVERAADTAALRLRANERTRAAFPWDFTVTLRYTLRDATLRIEQRIETAEASLPFAFGFHPYFLVPAAAKAGARIPTSATRAWDNVAKEEIPLAPIDLSSGEVDLHLVDHGRSDASLVLGDGHRVELRASDAYRRWVVWTLPGRDFVCLEPWSAPAGALASGPELLRASRERPVDLWLEIAFA